MIKTVTMYCISEQGTELEYGEVYDGEFYGTYFHTNGGRYSADRFSTAKPPKDEPLNLKPKGDLSNIASNAPHWHKVQRYAELSKKHKCESFFVELLIEGLI
jgi:hypothetical protein